MHHTHQLNFNARGSLNQLHIRIAMFYNERIKLQCNTLAQGHQFWTWSFEVGQIV